MAEHESRPGQASLAFSKPVGSTLPAASLPLSDLLLDARRFPSEGCWAFCTFTSKEVPAVRMGFQRGGFNITAADRLPDPSLLQLHLEIMTRDGAILWLPTGRFPAGHVESHPHSLDISLREADREILRITGWPEMDWSLVSDDGEVEVKLHVTIDAVTILPDCLLPRCVFAMWESVGKARGTVRIRGKTERVEGRMFFDRPRVRNQTNPVIQRVMYLYTTMVLEDGSGIFGYHAEDESGAPIDSYCFGVHVSPSGQGRFLPKARLDRLDVDQDGLPRRWRFSWENTELGITADVIVRDMGMMRSWGSPTAPKSKKEYVIFPLVLDGQASVTEAGRRSGPLKGQGLAEYFNAALWKA